MQQGYGLGQETSTLEHQAQESVAECGDNCICVQLDGFDIKSNHSTLEKSFTMSCQNSGSQTVNN